MLIDHVRSALSHDAHVGGALAADVSRAGFYELATEGVLLAKFVSHVAADGKGCTARALAL
eukprot:6302993-Prymnesium_polylepis.1